jgi:hypothetical protein
MRVFEPQGGTDSGFFETEAVVRPTRLYLLQDRSSLVAQAVPLSRAYLHSSLVYILDHHETRTLFFWIGKTSSSVLRAKGRLFCERAQARDEVHD